MKTILDENLPEELADHLPKHAVVSVTEYGWAGIKNGKLLALIEAAQFDAFITADKGMQFEQTLEKRPFAVLLVSTNHRVTMAPHYPKIAAALDVAEKGKLTLVECGRFVPTKFRKPAP